MKLSVAIVSAALLCLSYGHSYGAPKIDFTQIVKGLDGKPFMVQTGETDKDMSPMTLGLAAARALGGSYSDEANLPGEEKFRRGALALKIMNDPAATLTAEEVSKVKLVIGKAWAPVIVAETWAMLDPAEATK